MNPVRVAVVYESLFGNTHAIAGAVAEGIRAADPSLEVTCLPVDDATDAVVAAADLVVVGAPTHVHGMSSSLSRRLGLRSERDAGHADRIDPDATGEGVRTWLHGLPWAGPGQRAAAFDTRADMKHAGSAADGIARRLRRRGYRMVAEPASFFIDDVSGPLLAGEVDRARVWGASLPVRSHGAAPARS